MSREKDIGRETHYSRVEEAGDQMLEREHAYRTRSRSHAHGHMTERDVQLMHSFESIDYWEPQSTVFKERLVEDMERDEVDNFFAKLEVLRWTLVIVIGICIGLWGFFMFQCIARVAALRNDLIVHVLETHGYHASFVGLAAVVGISTLMVACGSLTCGFFPSAAGSGIPDLMAYLNGVAFPTVIDAKNLVVKTISCIFAVSSGLPVGAEGPTIHIGALLGAVIPRGRFPFIKYDATHKPFLDDYFSSFRNSKEMRDFIATGAAAGVSSVFGAPVGGLLFVMEEIASFFSVQLATRVFSACLATVFTMNLFKSGFEALKPLPADMNVFVHGKVISKFMLGSGFGIFIPFDLVELLPAVLLGLLMGAHAAGFTQFNLFTRKLRSKYTPDGTVFRVLEPVLLALLWFSLLYALPLAWDCETALPAFDEESGSSSARQMAGLPFYAGDHLEQKDLFTALCPTDKNHAGKTSNSTNIQYNPMATLTLMSSESIMKLLVSRGTATLFPPLAVFVYFVVFSLFASYSAGMFLSTGIVIPILIIGSSGGRAAGELLHVLLSSTTAAREWLDPGLTALLGAAGFFAGISRLTFSLTVIMIETSADLRRTVPIMLTVVTAKFVADKLCHSLYHGQLHLKCVPFLDNNAHEYTYLDTYAARDIMTTPVTSIHCIIEVREMVELMTLFDCSCYPVRSYKDGCFKGTLLRSELGRLLWYLHYSIGAGANCKDKNCLDFSSVGHATYNDLLQVSEILTDKDLDPCLDIPTLPETVLRRMVDLTPYIDRSAFCVQETMCISRTYNMFRSLGVRHLVVVGRQHHILGIITRKDLIPWVMEKRLSAARDRRLAAETRSHYRSSRRLTNETPSVNESDDENKRLIGETRTRPTENVNPQYKSKRFISMFRDGSQSTSHSSATTVGPRKHKTHHHSRVKKHRRGHGNDGMVSATRGEGRIFASFHTSSQNSWAQSTGAVAPGSEPTSQNTAGMPHNPAEADHHPEDAVAPKRADPERQPASLSNSSLVGVGRDASSDSGSGSESEEPEPFEKHQSVVRVGDNKAHTPITKLDTAGLRRRSVACFSSCSSPLTPLQAVTAGNGASGSGPWDQQGQSPRLATGSRDQHDGASTFSVTQTSRRLGRSVPPPPSSDEQGKPQ